jgi:putative transposase
MLNTKCNEQYWSVDFILGALVPNGYFRTAFVMDYDHRTVLAIEIYENISESKLHEVLTRLVATSGCPMKLILDHDPKLITRELTHWASVNGVALAYSVPMKSAAKGRLERVIWNYQKQVLNSHQFQTLNDVQEMTDIWLKDYKRRQLISP